MIPAMRNAVTRWTIYFAALLVVGPLAGSLTAALRTPTGSTEATALVSSSPILGLGAAVAAVVLAGLVGLVAVRLVNVHSGMTAAGLVLAWATWRTGTVDELIRAARSDAPLVRLAFEGGIFGILGVALAALLVAAARPSDPEAPAEPPPRKGMKPRPPAADASLRERLRRAFPRAEAAAGIGAGLLAGAAAAWLIAQEPLKGQALAAAVVGGVAAGVVGRLVDSRTPILGFFIAMATLAIAGPITGMLIAPRGGAFAAVNTGTLFPLAVPLPLDWIAGALLGIPLGAAWAASMVEKSEGQTARQP